MKIQVITLFPDMFGGVFGASMLWKAQDKAIVELSVVDLRQFGVGHRKTVDDTPYGGGDGMLLMPEPLFAAVEHCKKLSPEAKVLLMTPRGFDYTQKHAQIYAAAKQDLIIICGRYEGVDERVAEKLADMEISIGEYDLMGGELPAMVCIETISRLIPGVLGKPQLLKERVSKTGGFLEYAQFSRPEIFVMNKKKLKVPKVLISGDHKKIDEWKKAHGKVIEK